MATAEEISTEAKSDEDQAEVNSSLEGATDHHGGPIGGRAQEGERQQGTTEPDAISSSAESSDGPANSDVVVQSGELVDFMPFTAKVSRPMMEMRAGSNVWYQAHIQEARQTKLLVLFPATSRQHKAHKEWVLRSSSRIWRGSLASREWKYLASGAWQPKEGKARTAARRKRGAGNASSAAGSGGRTCGPGSTVGTSLTPSGNNDAAQSTADNCIGGPALGEEPDVASPPKRMRAISAESPRGRDPLDTAAEKRPSEGARPAKQNVLAAWFSRHFRLLANAGLLSEDTDGSVAPEAGWFPAGSGSTFEQRPCQDRRP